MALPFSGQADDILNLDLTATETSWYIPKVGRAAVGASDTDFWNAYNYTNPTRAMSNLKWATGIDSGVNLTMRNAGGAWGFTVPDQMFSVYLYGGSPAEAEFSNVPAGTYDVYTYAHGEPDNENANIEVLVDGTTLGFKSTSDAPGWKEPLWTEGKQYVVFKNVSVAEGDVLLVKAHSASSNLGLMNGIQLVRTAVAPPPPPPITAKFLNLDLTATQTPWYVAKVGKAATGATDSDFWNAYNYVSPIPSISDLKWADGINSGIGVNIHNAQGAWGFEVGDQMFSTYLYPSSKVGAVETEFTNVPAGTYDVYAYAHGDLDAENADVEVLVQGASIGSKSTSSAAGWKSPLWTDGKQYVVFSNITVSAGFNLLIKAKPAALGYGVLNGVQLVKNEAALPELPLLSLISVDFSAHTNPSFSEKKGLAAVGFSADDLWNWYSRDGTNGEFLDSNTIENLRYSNGTNSQADLLVENAAGAWVSGSSDPMLNSYLYPISRSGKITATFTDLYPGYYDVYVYAHGEPAAENAKIQVFASLDYGVKATSSSSDWNAEPWKEGKQFVLYQDVLVTNGGKLIIYSANGAADIAVINGAQLLYKGQVPSAPVAPTIVTQPSNVEVVSGNSASFVVTVAGTSPITYQWHLNGSAILGATNSQLTIPVVGESHVGIYYVQATNAAGFATSQEVNLSLIPLQLPPEIAKQPSTQTILLGNTAIFSVEAKPNPTVAYQWYFEGAALPGQNSSTLEIAGAMIEQAGNYHVVLSNSGGRIESRKARLFFYEPTDKPLLNVDYTAHLNPAFSTKVGPAAVGKTQEDYWNVWSRDTEEGGWQADGEVSNLKWSDSSASNIRLSVSNAAGAWYTFNYDPMFQSYLYPLGQGGNIESVFTGLPQGTYDILVYAHGEPIAENAEILVVAGNRPASARSTSNAPDWDKGNWQESHQYVRFNNVGLELGESLRIRVAGGEAGLAVINGIQFVLQNGIVAPFNPVVADWTFEEGIVDEAVANVVDHSGNHHHSSAILGEPVYVASENDAEGHVSISLPPGEVFGSGFRVADHYDFNLGNEFTLEAIITPGSANLEANRGIIVGQDARTGQLAYGLDYRGETRTVNFLIVNSAGETAFVDAVLPEDGKSHHVAGVYQNKTLSIYLDKVLVKSLASELIIGISQGGKGRVTVGANDIGGFWFNGSIDRVRISRKALTPSEFAPHKAAPGEFMIVKQPRNVTVNQGEPAAFTVGISGNGEVNYQWFKNGETIPDSNAATYQIASAALGDAGNYAVTVTSTNGVALQSLSAVLTVETPVPPTAPQIVKQPSSQTIFVGANVKLTVEATGAKPMTYQWFRGNQPVEGANKATLNISNIQVEQAGNYSVIISNKVGFVQSAPAEINVIVRDVTAPVVAITSPSVTETSDSTIVLAGKVSDNVGVVNARWERNGHSVGPLVLDAEGNFSINLTLAKGLNRFSVVAIDAAGNVGSSEVAITLIGSRALVLVTPPPAQEGTIVSIPIELTSKGDVAAVTFQITFDGNMFAEPSIVWDEAATGSFTQFNLERTNRIRAAFALPGVSLPAGKQTIGTLKLRVRSNPSPRMTDIALNVIGVYSALGDPIIAGTDAVGTRVSVLHRNYKGDNNGNDRLDSGDATIIMRLVTMIDPRRSWDITNNDMNLNNDLDSGDIIRVLRAVVGLDPQPGVQPTQGDGIQARQGLRTMAAGPSISLVADKTDARPGETFTVKMILSGNLVPISGASFTLEYPESALKLINNQAHRTGELIPSTGATVLWNIAPSQNDYEAQNGIVRMATSSPNVWAGLNGELAVFTFVVQEGAASAFQLPINVTQAEVTSGFDVQGLANVALTLKGREAAPAQFAAGASVNANGEFTFTINGEAGAQYLIETSTNLVDWTLLTETTVSAGGSVEIKDAQAGESANRFYRATLVE
ncbi:MAG: immunoglobulin domain-containing protein [Verrucomicrobiales bacterium]